MPQRCDGAEQQALLSPGLELDVLDGGVVDGDVEVVNGAHDGGVQAVGEDFGGEGVPGLDIESAPSGTTQGAPGGIRTPALTDSKSAALSTELRARASPEPKES